MEAIIIPSRSA